jgi:hypothetical protein
MSFHNLARVSPSPENKWIYSHMETNNMIVNLWMENGRSNKYKQESHSRLRLKWDATW